MKKRTAAVCGVGIAVCVLAVLLYKNSTAQDAKSVAGEELFTDEFVESVTSIDFRPFDESGVIAIKDEEKVDEFFKMLRNETYQTLDEYDWVEGSYRFDFVTDDGTVGMGISGDVIAFGGSQRRVVSGNHLLQGVIGETLQKAMKEAIH